MKKFLLGAFVGLLFAAVCVVVVLAVLWKMTSGKAPSIPDNSVLVLNLDGDVPEVPPVNFGLPFGENQAQPTIRDLWTALHAAAADPKVKAILLKPHGLAIGWGKLEELRQDLVDFKSSGKPIYAYLQTPGMHEYYLASVADKIYVSPDDYLEIKGFRIEAVYLKNTLDKLGISFDVDHIGRYKDAGDILTQNSMSPETREVLNAMLDQVFGNFCSTVAASRHKSADDLRSLIDQGPFLASAAKDAGLVDELGYESQTLRDLKAKVKARSDLVKTGYRSYARANPGSGQRIAFLAASGDIIRGTVDQPLGQADVIASETFSRTIQQVRNDKSIKGVILRVDSPGGDAVASDEILHEVKLLAAEKPLVISMSDVAASGGYFISATGDPIVAYPNTVTGSIGVIYGKPNLHGLYDKLGVTKELLMRGKFAGIDSDYTPLSDAEKQKLHQGIEATYRSFVTKVATARKKTYDQIDPLAQGRVWMGAQASSNGLVDHLGGLNEAVQLARQKAKLGPNEEIMLVPFPPKRSLFDVLFNSNTDSMVDAQVSRTLKSVLGFQPNAALVKGGILEVLPYTVTFR
jgi:protease IV